MLIKWDTLLIAVAVAGGAVLIENSHRIDTGLPDDDVTASAPAACIETTRGIEVRSDTPLTNDGDSAGAKNEAALPPVPSCSDE